MAKPEQTHLFFTNQQRKEAAKWEYKIVPPANHGKVTHEINVLAMDGWEIHTFSMTTDEKFSALLRRDATGAQDADSKERAIYLDAIKNNPNSKK